MRGGPGARRGGPRIPLLLSVKPKWCRLILAERKTVELRRRTPKHLKPGNIIVLYESAPTSAIVGEVECSQVEVPEGGNAYALRFPWLHRERTGQDIIETACYFDGASSPCAIWLREAREYARPIELRGGVLRWTYENYNPLKAESSFRPPQSMRYIDAGTLAAIRQAAGADSPRR